MKLLFIVPYTPNLIRVRPYQLLRALAARGHSITLATLWTSAAERAELQSLRDFGIQVIAERLPLWRSLGNSLLTLPTRLPLQAHFCWQPGLAKRIAALLEQDPPDAVHVEHLRGAAYGLLVKRLGKAQGRPVPVVWDSVDCISHLFEQAAKSSRSRKGQLLTRLDLARTRRFEGKLVHQFDQVVVTSPTDQKALAALAQCEGVMAANVHVIGNGVDLSYFTPGAGPRSPAALVFSGKMSYHANVTAAVHLVRDIMPLVWAQRPDVEVWLVGKDPAAEVRALGRNGDAAGGPGRVVVTGTVPDIRPYLQSSTLAVAPVPYGAGIQNKVLEAMACAAPVITSPQACSALQVEPGRDLLVAEGADAFAAAIVQLLADPVQQQRMGETARQYVTRYHSWDAMAACFEQLYQKTIAQNVSPLPD
jgi:glycosyltransferase involved in cell wall biosynthesis